MTLRLDEVASFTERLDRPRARRRITAGADGWSANRRTFVQAALATGAGLGMTVLGRLPTAQAACTTTLETTIRGSCPSNIAGTCSPACGPSTVYADACSASGWHKTSGNFRMRPNNCPSSPYDGWRWTLECCGTPGCFRTFKCHDGCRLTGGQWVNSICRTATVCAC